MLLSCAVVAYCNDIQEVDAALKSVVGSVKNFPWLRVSLYLIDNSPTERLKPVAYRYGAEYMHLPHNPGFGAAHNIAIQKSFALDSQYHLVLNPDVQFSEEVLPELVTFLETHQDVGLVMPDVRYPDGQRQHLCKLLPSPLDLFLRRFLPSLYEQSGRRDQYELRLSGYNKLMEVPALSGCFMLIRTAILRCVGGFDRRFFMYLEDVDLSRRIGKVARTVYNPHVSITHEYAKGSYKSWKPLFSHIRSAILYFNKWGWFFDAERREINRRTLAKLEAGKTSIELQ